jgi:hypothetical protein
MVDLHRYGEWGAIAMTTVALILFLVAAAGGGYMAFQRVQGREIPPTGLALAHGTTAGVALVLLIVAVVGDTAAGGLLWWSIGLFVVAGLGGSAMFLGYHLRGRALPTALVFAHGGLALIAFAILVAALLSA